MTLARERKDGDPPSPTFVGPYGGKYSETNNPRTMLAANLDPSSDTSQGYSAGGSKEASAHIQANDRFMGDHISKMSPIIAGLGAAGVNRAKGLQENAGRNYAAQFYGTAPSVANIRQNMTLGSNTNNLVARMQSGNPAGMAGAMGAANVAGTNATMQGSLARQKESAAGAVGYSKSLGNIARMDVSDSYRQADSILKQRDVTDKYAADAYDREQKTKIAEMESKQGQAADAINLDKMVRSQEMARNSLDTQAKKDAFDGYLKAGMTVATALAMVAMLFSDKRAKENIGPGDSVRKTMDSLRSYDFNYKGQAIPRGGIMAQDLEKTPLGKSLVSEVGGTKAVDVPQATGLALAGMADLNTRLKKLESSNA